MTLTDDDHDAARIIKDLERRVSDLEEASRATPTPNILVNESEEIGVSDVVTAVTETTIQSGAWDETGYDTSSWGHYARS